MSPPPRTMCAWQVGPRGRIHSPVLCSSRCCRHAGMMTTLSLNADRSPFAPPPHLTGRETKAREWGVSPCEGLEPGLSESSTYAPQHDVAPPHRWGVKSRVLPWGGGMEGRPRAPPSLLRHLSQALPPHAVCPSVALGVPNLGSDGPWKPENGDCGCTKWGDGWVTQGWDRWVKAQAGGGCAWGAGDPWGQNRLGGRGERVMWPFAKPRQAGEAVSPHSVGQGVGSPGS